MSPTPSTTSEPSPGRSREWVAPALLIALTVWILWPLVGGAMPVTHDHPVHLYKAWLTWTHFLPEGRASGWDSTWFFGYPAGDLYPIGLDLWVCLFRALTLGQLGWEATYALSLVGGYALQGLAVWALGRRLFGAWPAWLAATLVLVDVGALWEGGYRGIVTWGVVSQAFSTVWVLLGLAWLVDALSGRAGEVRAGAAMAAAVVFHPAALPLLALALPVVVAAHALDRGQGASGPSLRALTTTTAATCGLAFLLSAGWLVPFVARRGDVAHFASLIRTTDPTPTELLQGGVFAAGWPLWPQVALVTLGVALALRRARQGWPGIVALLLILVSWGPIYQPLVEVAPALKVVPWRRMLAPAKPLVLLMAAWGVVSAARWLGAATQAALERAQRPALLAAATAWMLVVGGTVTVTGLDLVGVLHKRDGQELSGQAEWWGTYEEMRSFVEEVRQKEGSFFRVAFQTGQHDHRFMSLPVWTGVPYYKVGFTPAQNFKRVVEHSDLEFLKILSVKYYIGEKPRPDLAPWRLRRLGRYTVYELPGPPSPRWRLDGEGQVESLAFEDEHIHLRLSQIKGDSRLVVMVSWYDRWRATFNGQEVPILPALPASRARTPLVMEFEARDGDLVLDYVSRPVDHVGRALSGAGVLVGLGWGWRRRRAQREKSS